MSWHTFRSDLLWIKIANGRECEGSKAGENMKKCPFCAEDIQDGAVKCRYCGEFLNKEEKKWYFKTYWLVIAFLCIGPLALPLLWVNPRFSKRNKIIISVIVIILSYYLTVITFRSVATIKDYYQEMNDLFAGM